MDRSNFTSHAFGRVVRHGGAHGYDAFFPEPLPRDLPLDAQTIRALSDADAALGRLAGVGRVLPNPHLLVRPYMLREAVASARIEGTQASISDVYEVAAGTPSNPDVEEVLNYVEAMERGMARLADLPLSSRLIREIHGVLLAGVRGRDRRPGELRRSQNWIEGTSPKDAVFVPPPHEELGECLSDWGQFAHHEGTMPDLVQCGLLHYQFETIHPFLDGNGRLGRLLIVFFLVIRDRLPGPLLYISPYLEARRQEYYRRLQAVRERGEVQEWLRFFLGAVEHQASDAIARADALVDLRERYRQDIMAQTRSQAPAVVDIAFDSPVLNARLVEAELDITRTGARNLLIQLEEFGVLAPYEPGPRNLRRWVAPEILRVVSE